MKLLAKISLCAAVFGLTACAVSPEQQIAREKQRVKAEQDLQVNLAKQCDVETAELMFRKFNPPLSVTEKEQKKFDEQYAKKVNEPVFQACYKLAWQNYIAQQQLEEMRFQQQFDDFDYRMGRRFCYFCRW